MLVALNTTFVELTVTRDGAVLPELVVSTGDQSAFEVFLNPVGPKGEKGDQGNLNDASVGDLGDVVLTTIQEGDILIYQSSKFVNQPKTVLVDGGNF